MLKHPILKDGSEELSVWRLLGAGVCGWGRSAITMRTVSASVGREGSGGALRPEKPGTASTSVWDLLFLERRQWEPNQVSGALVNIGVKWPGEG